jgi:hypothetical protein
LKGGISKSPWRIVTVEPTEGRQATPCSEKPHFPLRA